MSIDANRRRVDANHIHVAPIGRSVDPKPSSAGKLARAEQFIRTYLAHGPKYFHDLARDAAAIDIAKRTLQRAALSLGVTHTRDGKNGPWIWSLSESEYLFAAPAAAVEPPAQQPPEPPAQASKPPAPISANGQAASGRVHQSKSKPSIRVVLSERPLVLRGEQPQMPPGVRLLSWRAKAGPVSLSAYSVITDIETFIHTTLEQLDACLRGQPVVGNWTAEALLFRLQAMGVVAILERTTKEEM